MPLTSAEENILVARDLSPPAMVFSLYICLLAFPEVSTTASSRLRVRGDGWSMGAPPPTLMAPTVLALCKGGRPL
jgi:hypothetical protein